MKRSYLFLILGFLSSGSILAQETVVVSGGSGSGSGGTSTYSVGQVLYTEIAGNNSFAIQGVQQPYEISVLSIKEHPTIMLEAIVYPNPTQNNIILKIVSTRQQNYKYELFDARGRLLLQNRTTGIETSIPLETFPSSTYILMVRSGKSLLKSFKIIKN